MNYDTLKFWEEKDYVPSITTLQDVAYYTYNPDTKNLEESGELVGEYDIIDLNAEFEYIIARCMDTNVAYLIARESIRQYVIGNVFPYLNY